MTPFIPMHHSKVILSGALEDVNASVILGNMDTVKAFPLKSLLPMVCKTVARAQAEQPISALKQVGGLVVIQDNYAKGLSIFCVGGLLEACLCDAEYFFRQKNGANAPSFFI